MTSPVSDALAKAQALVDEGQRCGRLYVTDLLVADLAAILATKAKEEDADQSPADEVERVVSLFTAFCRGMESRNRPFLWDSEASDNAIKAFRAEVSAIRNGDEGMGGDRARWNCACSNPPFEGDEILRNDGAIACPNCQRPLSGDPEPQRPNK